MKYTVTQKLELRGSEQKGNVMLYTFLDENLNKISGIGNPVEGLEIKKQYDVTIDITLKSERFELKDGKVVFVDTARKFISEVK